MQVKCESDMGWISRSNHVLRTPNLTCNCHGGKFGVTNYKLAIGQVRCIVVAGGKDVSGQVLV